MSYQFFVHATMSEWRLVKRNDTSLPGDARPDEWRFTRSRDADDVNPDVRNIVDTKGWCLFKLGGTFAEVDAALSQTKP